MTTAITIDTIELMNQFNSMDHLIQALNTWCDEIGIRPTKTTTKVDANLRPQTTFTFNNEDDYVAFSMAWGLCHVTF